MAIIVIGIYLEGVTVCQRNYTHLEKIKKAVRNSNKVLDKAYLDKIWIV